METKKRKRELLFSVSAKDCTITAIAAGGKGGQHQNKTATAVRVVHKPSGAMGYAKDHKSQHRNKKIAFRRMAESKEFKTWVRIEAARVSGDTARIEKKVEKLMDEKNIRTEVHDEKGRWEEVKGKK